MSRFEFLWSLFLVAVLVLISMGAEFFIPRPTPTRRAGVALHEPTGEAKQGTVLYPAKSSAEYAAAAVSQAASLPYAEEVNSPWVIPIRNASVPPLSLEARSALALDLTHNEVLFEKNIDTPLPIASITKLMSAIVAREKIPPDTVITVSKNAVATEGAAGGLWVGETLSLKKLLYFLLLPSSNDAAIAIAEHLGVTDFIALMNAKAAGLGLRKAAFNNPNGLDTPAPNSATAAELAMLGRELWRDEVLAGIVGTASIDIASEDGKFQHHVVSSNKLLGIVPGVVGGKTGFTEDAGQTMLLLIDLPAELKRHTNERVQIVTVLLSSPDRLAESRKLVEWLYQAYEW